MGWMPAGIDPESLKFPSRKEEAIGTFWRGRHTESKLKDSCVAWLWGDMSCVVSSRDPWQRPLLWPQMCEAA